MINLSRERLNEIIKNALKKEFPEALDFKVEVGIRSEYSDDGFCHGDYDEIKIWHLTESPKRKTKKWEYMYF